MLHEKYGIRFNEIQNNKIAILVPQVYVIP